MFKAVIGADRLKETLAALLAVTEEARLNINQDGIEIRAVDPANVAMVKLVMKPAAFDFYKVDKELVGLDLVRLEDVLTMADKSEPVTLEFEDAKLILSIDNMKYRLGLIDPDAIRKEPRIPELDLPVTVGFSSKLFVRMVKAAEKVSDHIYLGMTDDTFVATSKGDIDDVNLKIGTTELLECKPGEAKSMFSLDYLKNMSKAIAKSDEVRLQIGIDYPVSISFKVNDNILVEYMMAPRIEQD